MINAEIVSIHATLAGGDPYAMMQTPDCLMVSIHATLAGGDTRNTQRKFGRICFYPRHPRGWRPSMAVVALTFSTVSIHATLAGGDFVPIYDEDDGGLFLSTPPSRVATAFGHRPFR